MTDEILYPETIEPEQLPTFGGDFDSLTQESSNSGAEVNAMKPQKSVEAKFPSKYIARATISETINTQSKQILGSYTFGMMGALVIGTYEFGVSGDLRISPDGIVARNINGDTTFSLNGATGDATFRGSVSANDFQITGSGIIATATEGRKSLGGFTSIQDAIDWVDSFGGGEIIIPTGTYTIAADITLYSNITLIGQDDDLTILDFNNTTYKMIAVGTFSDPLVNIHISGLQFKNGHNVTTGTLDFDYINDSSIRDCRFVDNYDGSDGRDIWLNFNDCNRITIINCRSEGGGYFFYGGGFNISIKDCFAEDCNKTAIYANSNGFARGIIYGNYLKNPTEDGIYLGLNSTDTVIDSNYIYSVGRNGVVAASPFIRIVNNTIDSVNEGEHQIILNSSLTTVTNNLLYRINASYSSIYINNTDRSVINGNLIYGGGETPTVGVTLIAGSTKNIITSNVIYNVTTSIVDGGTSTIAANNALL